MKSICDRLQSSMLDQVRAEKRKLDEMKLHLLLVSVSELIPGRQIPTLLWHGPPGVSRYAGVFRSVKCKPTVIAVSLVLR